MNKKPNEVFHVFVYGTLKAGQSNHPYYLTGASFIGKGQTVKPFKMHDNGGFPVVFDIEDKPVSGELYEVSGDVLYELDQLEGHPRFFKREEIEVTIDDPIPLGTKKALMYFGNQTYWKNSIAAGLPLASVDGSGAYSWSRQ